LGRGASIAAGPFPQAARRTRRACLHATGSPWFLPWAGSRPTVELGLHLRYPPPRTHASLIGRVGVHAGDATIRWRIFRHYSLQLSSRFRDSPEPLPPFALWPALPVSTAGRDSCDYYGGSAPPLAGRPTVCPARRTSLAATPPGRPGVVPVFTCRSLGGGGIRLGPCDIAVATPQHVTPASPQSRRHVGEFPASVMREAGARRLRPRSARFEPVRL